MEYYENVFQKNIFHIDEINPFIKKNGPSPSKNKKIHDVKT